MWSAAAAAGGCGGGGDSSLAVKSLLGVKDMMELGMRLTFPFEVGECCFLERQV